MAAWAFMKLATLRRRNEQLPGISGVARLDRRTMRLATRLNAGDIAVIDQVDLDRVSAEALIAAKPVLVVNAQPSISGRYPNLGPELIVAHGIGLVDNVGSEVFAAVKEGTRIRVDGTTVWIGDTEVANGTVQDESSIAALMIEARSGLTAQLNAFAVNTAEYMNRDRDLLLDGVGIPDVRTKFAGRHVVVVVRGYDYAKDLKALKHYIREFKPVLIGVDGGADALIEAGHKPHLIVGDMDAVSDAAIASGAEVVVHAYPDGRAPGLERVQDLGVGVVNFPSSGTSEDAAMLLADAHGATLIVAVGTHATLTEFLDRGRAGMASTFLTRLRVGAKLVDARGASVLYRNRISAAALLLLVLAALIGSSSPRSPSPTPAGPTSTTSAPGSPTVQMGGGPVLVISFRYHIVSLVAIFLALAVGIVVGTTALNGPVTHDLRNQVNDLQSQRSQLANRVKVLQGQVDNAGQFATTFGSRLVAGSLTGQKVLVVALPGASTGIQDGVSTELTAAGASITGRVQLSASFIDPAQGSSIVTLATSTHPFGLSLPETNDAGKLGGALLGYVLLGKGNDTDLKTVLSGFSGLHMISSDPAGVEAADTVVVLGAGSLAKAAYAGRSESDLVSALSTAGGTVVVAGDSGSATGNGNRGRGARLRAALHRVDRRQREQCLRAGVHGARHR